jgi:excisionase family DNA binding protein
LQFIRQKPHHFSSNLFSPCDSLRIHWCMTTSECITVTPPQLARRYGVHVDKIMAWIRAGELRALNLATRPSGRARWRIKDSDLAEFEARRTAVPKPQQGGPPHVA